MRGRVRVKLSFYAAYRPQRSTAPLAAVGLRDGHNLLGAARAAVRGFVRLVKAVGGENEIGFVQSAFMFGIGLGGLTCATLLRRFDGIILPGNGWPVSGSLITIGVSRDKRCEKSPVLICVVGTLLK